MASLTSSSTSALRFRIQRRTTTQRLRRLITARAPGAGHRARLPVVSALFTAQELNKLYEVDEVEWMEQAAELLRQRQLELLDLDQLSDVISTMSRNEKRNVEHEAVTLYLHLLFLAYWGPELQNNHRRWQHEVAVFRLQLLKDLTPSLQAHLEDNISYIYEVATARFYSKTRYEEGRLPEQPPFTLEQLLDRGWYPVTTITSEDCMDSAGL